MRLTARLPTPPMHSCCAAHHRCSPAFFLFPSIYPTNSAGHRVYKNYDPRAKIIRKVAEEVFSILGKEPLIEVAVELERIALSDPFFVERKLYPNVDFYSGLIYKSMGQKRKTNKNT